MQGPKPAARLSKDEPEGTAYDYENKIDFAVFPSLQGGPHNHQIGALAVALKYVATEEFKQYVLQVGAGAGHIGIACTSRPPPQSCCNAGTCIHATWPPCNRRCIAVVQVQANSRALAARLMSHGYKLVTDGTDNHLVLWDLRPEAISGSKMEKVCDLCHITLNKNAVVGDVSAMNPGGVRIGERTCAAHECMHL